MRRAFLRMTENEMVRYLFFGGCTTAVNLAVFSVLCYLERMPVMAANLLSIAAAMIFAFVVNKWFVFQNGGKNVRGLAEEFLNFIGMRFLTMLIEIVGVDMLIRWMGMAGFTGKLVVQVIVIVLNYVISKHYVFRDSMVSGGMINE